LLIPSVGLLTGCLTIQHPVSHLLLLIQYIEITYLLFHRPAASQLL
jgi:hypothetical protein